MKFFTRIGILSLFLTLFTLGANALTADFTADYLTGCAPLVVHFHNTSSGAVSYYWDLGNGTTSTLTDVSGSYLTPGTYTVTLTSTSSSGATSVHTTTITVNPAPIVSFYADDTAVCPGTFVNFTSTSTAGVSGCAMTYLWNFGDGSSSTAAAPSHAYGTPGSFHITLTVTNCMGCVTTLTRTSYITVFTPPSVTFGASPTYFCHPAGTSSFTATGSGTSPLTYAWTFGDGGTGTGTTPTNTYASSGVYTVKLYVSDGNGCQDSIIRPNYITVGTTVASFTSVSTACRNTVVTFPNTSSTHLSSYWTFGDGGSSSADTGSHSYSTPGTYPVRLIIFNGYCYDTVIHSIIILPAPTGSFTMSPSQPCPAPATVSFTGTVASGTSISWLFGDGSSGSGASTAHTYSSNGTYTVRMCIMDASGCVDTIRQTLTIYDLHFHLEPDVQEGCAPLTVRFFSSLTTLIPSMGPYPYRAGSSYSWTFGDGTTSTASVPTHIYTAQGSYTAVCTVTTANGCVIVDSTYIRVGVPPHAIFTATPMHVCYGDSVVFHVTVDSGVADNFLWYFDDGSTVTDSGRIYTHRYLLPGFFNATITPMYHGCPGNPWVLTDTIIVDSPMAIPMVRYNCTPYTSVTFIDSSWGATSIVWLFGDGSSSTLDSVTHIYSSRTSYIYRLCTYNSRTGCRDTADQMLIFAAPHVDIRASDTTICMNDTVRFFPAPGTDTMVNYAWYIDWTIRRDFDLDGYFTDTFRLPGHYSVMMTYDDERDCRDTLIKTNWITVGKPVDSFTAATTSGCGPFTASFTDRSTVVSGTSLASYIWDYGDGVSSGTITTSTVSHTYTAAGTYTVTTIVTDNIGCTDTATRPSYITVWRPRAAFGASTTYPCVGAGVTFSNLSTGYTSSYWQFGDGDTSSATSPVHIYQNPGTYTVRLIVYDTHGCRDTSTATSYIRVTRPDASFSMSDSFTICAPLNDYFYNSSTGAVRYNWALGNGATSTLTSPTNLYTASGVYTVTLIATNSYGCKDTAYKTVVVYGYAGAFTYSPLTGCSPLTVHFNASLSNVPNIIWDFADGTTTTASRMDTTSHTYTLPGAYVPKLILSDNSGCQNSSAGIDTIKVDAVTPGFTTVPYPVCVHADINFRDTSRSFFSTVVSEHWTFHNGDTSIVPNPSYRYDTVGTYPVLLTAVDGWGCVGTVLKNVVVNPPPNIVGYKDTTICVGDTASLWGYGGATYSWTPTGSAICATCQPALVNPSVMTTYTVTGIDTNGCSNTDTVQVRLRTTTESGAWGDTSVCRYVPVQLFDTGGSKYTWIPSSGLSNPRIYNPIATPSVTTKYMVIAQLGNCVPDTNFVSVIVHQLPTVDAGLPQRVLAGTVVFLNATGTLINNYLWTPNYNLTCDTCHNPSATMMTTTTYYVEVASAFGCKATDSVTIDVYCDESQIFIPNSFTPNGDGQNDVFYPRGGGIGNISAFRIFNRWGELVFEKTNFAINDVSAAWDGSFNGGPARPDVYVYLLEATCATGKPLFYKGSVTIVK